MPDNGRVLIADDETATIAAMADLLAARGYDCDCVGNAADAIDAVRRNPYDVLISDIKMPGNFSLELIDYVKEHAPGLPVILITGYPSLDTAISSIGAPVAAYLLKPVDIEELVAKVRECVQRSQVSQYIDNTKQHLSNWHTELETTGSVMREPSAATPEDVLSAFVSLNLRNVASSLSQFSQLTDQLAKSRSPKEEQEMVASTRVETAHGAIVETIRVLEETRDLFKSKKLGRLRRKLQTMIDTWE